MNENILLIDKDAGWTSFDVVAWVRSRISEVRNQNGEIGYTISEKPIANSKKLKAKIKVGHAGTLDPFATGLLIVLVGKDATKRQDEFMKQDKEYEAVLELGKTSMTGDPEGTITPYCHSGIASQSEQYPESRKAVNKEKELDSPPERASARAGRCGENDKKEITNVLKSFIGEIDQIPPAYSAIKINGKKAYELARKGIDPKLKSRKVHIHDIKITDYKWPFLKLRIQCGSGTYIRSLATDIGEALEVGAYLTELRRTKIGEFDVKDASKTAELTQN